MTSRHPHAPRIDRVMTHIHRNLAGELSLDELSEVAALSRFHFSRVFREITGEGAAEVVRRIRLNRAAVVLVATEVPLARIATSCGYGSGQSFERAFRRAFGITPKAARGGHRMLSPLIPSKTGDWTMYPVETRAEDGFTIAALPHRGAYAEIGAVFDRLDRAVREAAIPSGPSVGIYYDNPQEVALADLRSHAGRVVAPADVPAGLDRIEIDGGDFLVLTHVGPFTGLPAAWHYVFNVAIPERGVTPRDGLPFERYLNNTPDTPIEKVITEICVPVTTC